MKKLKLIGLRIKKGWFGRQIRKQVGIIYVKDSNVIIESKLPSLRALRNRIQEVGDAGGFGIEDCIHTPHSREHVIISRHKTDDPKFLEALKYARWWQDEYDGWDINITASPIIDE